MWSDFLRSSAFVYVNMRFSYLVQKKLLWVKFMTAVSQKNNNMGDTWRIINFFCALNLDMSERKN